ncbi:helix-turn-helix domain-containing protein [Bacillus cereus group sp. BceL215]|uniref:helix-turn-helix domain-containing protein n=1 Tax=Bacillus cereus group sp. BceL215 TaxID=3445015 RepID=UPI003F25C20F
MEKTRGNEQVENKGERKLILDLTNRMISEQIRIMRCADNLTQHELAFKLGFGYSEAPTLSRIENRRMDVPKRFIEPLEQYLYGEAR